MRPQAGPTNHKHASSSPLHDLVVGYECSQSYSASASRAVHHAVALACTVHSFNNSYNPRKRHQQSQALLTGDSAIALDRPKSNPAKTHIPTLRASPILLHPLPAKKTAFVSATISTACQDSLGGAGDIYRRQKVMWRRILSSLPASGLLSSSCTLRAVWRFAAYVYST